MEIGKELGLIEGKATRDAFGEALREIGAENSQIVVVDGDVSNSTRTGVFGDAFPDRFFNLGIAESNMVSVASGLTASGKIAVVSSFAVFLLANAYDQIRMGVAFPNLNVKLVGSHSGISIGEDGPSQMAIEDIGLAASFPNFTVIVPADEPSTKAATRAMINHTGPVYLRTGRPKVPVIYSNKSMDFQIGKANWLREILSQQKPALTIIACGIMVAAALDAARVLESQGIEAQVLDMHTIKPIDVESIRISAEETGAIVTAEEHLVGSGLGAAVARVVAETHPVPIEMVGIEDTYAQSGAPRDLMEAYGLTSDKIIKAAQRVLERKKK